MHIPVAVYTAKFLIITTPHKLFLPTRYITHQQHVKPLQIRSRYTIDYRGASRPPGEILYHLSVDIKLNKWRSLLVTYTISVQGVHEIGNWTAMDSPLECIKKTNRI